MKIQLVRNATMKITYAGRTLLTDPMLAPKDAYKPFAGIARNPTIELPFPIEEILGGIVCSKEHGSIREDGTIRLPVTGTPLFLSTEVTPEQEKATVNYLRPTEISDWAPIEGSEN